MKRRLMWWMFRLCWWLHLKRLASWFLIERRPLTPEEIAYAEQVWAKRQARGN